MGLFGNATDRRKNRENRRAARAARQAARQAGRSERASGRQAVRATAYENGFDPNASWQSVANNAVTTAGKFAGAGRMPAPDPGGGLTPVQGSNFGSLALLGVIAFFALK